MAERDAVRAGDAIIEFEVVRSRRRRRTMELTLDPRQGVRVAVPLRTSPEHIRRFVQGRADWIARQQRTVSTPPRLEFVTGQCVPFLGRPLPLLIESAAGKRSSISLGDRWLHIGVPAALSAEERRPAIERALTGWYTREALKHIEERVRHWAAHSSHHPSRVLIRNQRQRWGSCAPDGTLRINWRIVMAPPRIVDYVIVHELAHLAVRNHSPAFWAEVERVLPDYRSRKDQLRHIGPSLTLS